MVAKGANETCNGSAQEPLTAADPVPPAAENGTVEDSVKEDMERKDNEEKEEEKEVENQEEDEEKDKTLTLEDAERLVQQGKQALCAGQLVQAIDDLGHALEFMVKHYGELAPECATIYFKYGSALLYNYQERADVLNAKVSMSKKVEPSEKAHVPKVGKDSHGDQVQANDNGMVVTNTEDVEGKGAVGTDDDAPVKDAANTGNTKGKAVEGSGEEVEEKRATTEENEEAVEKEEGDSDDEDSDSEDVDKGEDEEDSDLDLAWKLLETARVILDKQEDTVEKADVISTLGDVSLEREQFEVATNDFKAALSILERLDEPDSRHVAHICFKVCLALQMENKIPEALTYCEQALSICSSRMQRLQKEVEASNGDVQPNLNDGSAEKPSEEITVLKGLMADLSDKVEDLKQMMLEPSLPELFRSFIRGSSAKNDNAALRIGDASSNVSNGFDQPSLPTHDLKVTNLGVVGRGVKRAVPIPVDDPEHPAKKVAVCNAERNADGLNESSVPSAEGN